MVFEFKVLGRITEIQTIAEGREIRELARLNEDHGKGRWRKRKGLCTVELEDGAIEPAEVHWYEAHGLGRRELKIKRLL